jgi:hypothetical protein
MLPPLPAGTGNDNPRAAIVGGFQDLFPLSKQQRSQGWVDKRRDAGKGPMAR